MVRWAVLLSMLVAIGIIVLVLRSPPVAAGPEPPSSIATAYNTQRKLVRAADGTLFASVTVNASGVPQTRVLSSTDGRAWAVLPAPSVSGSTSDRSALAIDSRGRLHLTWTDTVGADRQVYYARFESGSWSPAERLSSSPSYAGFSSIVVDIQDRPHIVWYGFDGTFYQVYYRRLDPTGWTPERALTTESVDATNPAIALGPEGHIHIAWFRQHRTGAYTEVAYLRLEGDAVAETLALSNPGVDSIDPTMAVDSGGVHIMWSAMVGSAARLQHIARSVTWSSVDTVSPPSPGAVHPTLAIDGRGRLHAVWEGTDGQIYAQVHDAGGWSPPAALSAGGLNRYPSARWSQFHNPLCGSDAVVDVVWTHEDAGAVSIAYDGIDAGFACPTSLTEFPLVSTLVAINIGAVVGIVLFAVLFRRKGYQKPPASPPS